jgi:hypothetical protein
MADQTVELHINELILHGFSHHDRYSIGESLQSELTRLFTDQGIPPSLLTGGNIELMNAGSFELPAGRKFSAGHNVAHSVYKGLSNDKQSFCKDGK